MVLELMSFHVDLSKLGRGANCIVHSACTLLGLGFFKSFKAGWCSAAFDQKLVGFFD